MKMKNTTRTRMTGYFGIAVATLLTPAGKLISSAVAAATVVGLISMSTPPKLAKVSMSAPPVVYTGTEYIDSELLNPVQLPGMEIGSDTSVSEETNEVIKLPSVASINVAATDSASNGPSGGGLPDLLPLGSGPGPDFPRGPDPKVPGPNPDPKPTECITLYSEYIKTVRADNEEETCEPVIVEAVNPEDKPGVKGPPDIPPVVLVDEDILILILNDVPPPIIESSPLVTPTGDQRILPLVTAAAIPEPSTLGLLLLGVIGFRWVHRRTTVA